MKLFSKWIAIGMLAVAAIACDNKKDNPPAEPSVTATETTATEVTATETTVTETTATDTAAPTTETSATTTDASKQ